MARREYKGAAVQTRLSANIGSGDTTFGINAAGGWPTGGANGPFTVILDPGQSTEEHVLVGSRTTLTLSSVTRGVDDTVAVAHSAGADGTIITGSVAFDFNEANRHINDTTIDEHTQYMMTSGTRHDLTARHGAGSVVPTATPVAVGTALSEGAGSNLARATHVHELGVGSIDASNLFAANVVDAAAIGADQVGSSEIAPLAVTSAELAADSVIAGKIADGGVSTTAEITDLIVTLAKIAHEESTSFSPAFANVTVGTGIGGQYGRYWRLGRVIVGFAGFILGTGGNVTGLISFTGPVPASDLTSGLFGGTGPSNSGGVLAGRAFDDSAGTRWSGLGFVTNTGTCTTFATAGAAAAWDNNTPFDWAINDVLQSFFCYQAAT